MLNELIALAEANPMTTALVIVVVLTAGAVSAALIHDEIEQRRLIELHAKLLALEAERDQLKERI